MSMLALDLDGPLLDPEPRQTAVLRWIFEQEQGRNFIDPDEVWELKRTGRSTESALMALGVPDEMAASLAARWADSIEEPRWLSLDQPFPGVIDLLSELAGGGSAPVIITARRHPDRVTEQAKSLGLMRWCAGIRVVSPDAATTAKADELRAIGATGFIGDTESDAAAANAAGVPFAAVATGQRSGAFLEERGMATFSSLGGALRGLGFGVSSVVPEKNHEGP
jgi:phosphoglycolate phosphatase